MTPDAVRLDLCTRSHEVCAAAVRGWPGAAVGDEPWFNFPYVEAQLPEELRQRWARQLLVPLARATNIAVACWLYWLAPTTKLLCPFLA